MVEKCRSPSGARTFANKMSPKRKSGTGAKIHSPSVQNKRPKIDLSTEEQSKNDAKAISTGDPGSAPMNEFSSTKQRSYGSVSTTSSSTGKSDPDSISESSESENESESESESEGSSGTETTEDRIVSLSMPTRRTKPIMDVPGSLSGATDMRSRIQNFLPRLQEANELLATDDTSYNMEVVDDKEGHIEMSLGLGVLEPLESNKEDDSDDEDTDDLDHYKGNAEKDSGNAITSDQPTGCGFRNATIVEKLQGSHGPVSKAKIEELG